MVTKNLQKKDHDFDHLFTQVTVMSTRFNRGGNSSSIRLLGPSGLGGGSSGSSLGPSGLGHCHTPNNEKLETNGPIPNVDSYLNSNIMPLVSYHYDYSPQDLESPKRPYVQTYFPAPPVIRPGAKVRVAFTTDHLHPAFYNRLPLYEIDDVEGYKIFLKPLFRTNLLRGVSSLRSENESPFEVPFAYTQTKIGDLPQRLVRGYYWGYGSPAAYLVLA